MAEVFEFPDESYEIIRQHLIASGYYEATVISTVTASVGGTSAQFSKSGKQLSGYNLFMKQRMSELKALNVPAGERMTQIGGEWKALRIPLRELGTLRLRVA